MKIYTHEQTASRLPFASLIQHIRELYTAGVRCPDRHSHTVDLHDEKDATLLLMPGWHGDIGCVKIVTVTPDNGKRNLPAVAASLLVFNRHTGQHLAMLDGDSVTVRRTAAASALAADYLAPKTADKLLVIGSGNIASQLPAAFSSVRPIIHVDIWNRSISGAQRLASELTHAGLQNYHGKNITFNAVSDLKSSVTSADIISAATLSTEPLIKGEWLRAGQHVDLIGSFTPTMREADDEVFRRGSVYVDSPFAAKESGEILIPINNGALKNDDIKGDLYDLTSDYQNVTHSVNDSEITVFKGAGNAVMDLAAAITALKHS